jgi:hypothetical protein
LQLDCTIRAQKAAKGQLGGIPAIVPAELYELAQYKLKHNQADKSGLHLKPEDFLLKSHIHCKSCGYRMGGRYRVYDGTPVGYYQCAKDNNKYDACPDMTEIMAAKVNRLVWEDCCRVFQAIEEIRDTIRANIERDVQSFLEHTTGTQQLAQLRQELAQAEAEQTKHAPGSYYYSLVTQDIQTKQEQLRKYEAESKQAATSTQLLDLYQQQVLGVQVMVSTPGEQEPVVRHVETDKEWLSLVEAGDLTGIDPKILSYRAGKGEFMTQKRAESRRCTFVHRDELNRFLASVTLRPQRLRDDASQRVEITYQPIFSGVQQSLIYTSVSSKAFTAG